MFWLCTSVTVDFNSNNQDVIAMLTFGLNLKASYKNCALTVQKSQLFYTFRGFVEAIVQLTGKWFHGRGRLFSFFCISWKIKQIIYINLIQTVAFHWISKYKTQIEEWKWWRTSLGRKTETCQRAGKNFKGMHSSEKKPFNRWNHYILKLMYITRANPKLW